MVEVKDINWSDKPKDVRKAGEFYAKKGKLNAVADIEKIEPYFLEANNFKMGKEFDCDYKWRHVIFNEDMTEYYCSPFYSKPAFCIRKCKDIESVELLDDIAGDGSLTGALLFGAAGAVAGSANKKAVLTIRLHTSDVNEPIVDLMVLTTPLSKGDKNFIMCFESANKIYGHFKAIVDSNRPAQQQSGDQGGDTMEVVEKIRQFKTLYDEGILTQEEFEAKKKQLLEI